jgi:tRNA threonylcarbamoyladenosine biosynthesis protein TsaE
VNRAEKGQSVILVSESPEQTFRIGVKIGRILEAGDFLALTGELGTGKTAFVQGIARGLGVSENYAVVSPTFTLVNVYPGEALTLYHMDLYRLGGAADLLDAGFDEENFQEGVTAVEWAERIQDVMPEGAISLVFSYVDEFTRKILISVNVESVRDRLKGVVF